MKYFIGTLTEMINGFEAHSKQMVTAGDEKQALEVLDKLASEWRDEEGSEWKDGKHYYFDGGGISVFVSHIKEVSQEEYLTLVKYI